VGPPVIQITQTPEYPRPGQFPKYKRGLVTALWSNGRMVRCASKDEIGKSYMIGNVSEKERDEFLAYVKSDEIMKLPKLAHLRLHAATIQITINDGTGRQKWICELPDPSSVWTKLEERMLALPMPDAKSADEATVMDAERE
jgi:hypothetical protein